MKSIGLLLLATGLGAGGLYLAKQQPLAPPNASENDTPAAQVVAAPATQLGPERHYVGKVFQRLNNGMLVECQTWKPYENKGGKAEDVTGSFFLVGHPQQSSLHDDAKIEFKARQSGTTTYGTTNGSTRTVRVLQFADGKQYSSWRERFNNPLDQTRKP